MTWIKTEESTQYKFYYDTGDLSIRSFWHHSSDTKRNPWVMLCSHCPTQFTLQLCYKTLGILQRVTKTQKVHISSHDGLQKLHNINIVWYKSQGFPERKQSSMNFSLLQSNFLRTIDLLFFIQWVYYSLTAIHSPQKYLRGTLISYERSNGGS